LSPTQISDGAFSGTTTGGALQERFFDTSIVAGTTTTQGSHAGLFTGSDGQEIVGGITIPHLREGRPLTEKGIFVAGRTGP
jgi:hypothetical protein